MRQSNFRRRRFRAIVLAALAAGVIVAAGAVTLMALGIGSAGPERHTTLHIGCKHGAHGLPWHARHGKSFSYEPGLRPRTP